MRIDVSIGEAIDKMTILEIKLEKITGEEKLANIRTELAMLGIALKRAELCLDGSDGSGESMILSLEICKLRDINRELWYTEDKIRAFEREGNFGPHFVAHARAIYTLNDRRSAVKREISHLTGSFLIEEKQHGG